MAGDAFPLSFEEMDTSSVSTWLIPSVIWVSSDCKGVLRTDGVVPTEDPRLFLLPIGDAGVSMDSWGVLISSFRTDWLVDRRGRCLVILRGPGQLFIDFLSFLDRDTRLGFFDGAGALLVDMFDLAGVRGDEWW